jgi:hypothetical protein
MRPATNNWGKDEPNIILCGNCNGHNKTEQQRRVINISATSITRTNKPVHCFRIIQKSKYFIFGHEKSSDILLTIIIISNN